MSASAAKPTVYVVDDDEAIRILWRWLMESNGIAVQTFASAAEFIAGYQPQEPACLVLDVRLPGMSGPELQEHLKQRGVEIPIVFVSGHGDVPTAVNAIKSGAVDFIQKPFGYRDMLAIIHKALQRDAELRKGHAHRVQVAARLGTLTERERDVLRCIIDGKANKAIAEELAISVKTVEFHRSKVMEKMRAGSVAELVQLTLNAAGIDSRPGKLGFSLMDARPSES